MTPIDIQSEAFAQATLRSERVRIIGLLWALGAIVVVAAVRGVLFGRPGEGQILTAMVVLAAAMAGYEALMLRFVTRSIADDRVIPPAVWPANVFIETLLPTLAILVLSEADYFGPYQSLVAPAGLVYFFFMSLSTLRLNPALCRLTGVFAAAGYMAVTASVYLRHPPPTAADFTLPIYATYGAFLLIGGFVAGGVATQIRAHVAAALREAETRRQKERLEHDLDLARSIQQGLLPGEALSVEGFEIAGWNQPADQTGGDYYDWQTLADGRAAVILADVTGHGIGPALVTAACRAYGRATLPVGEELGVAMGRINDLLVDDLPPGKMVTFVSAIVDPSASNVQLLSAGHGPLLVYTAADRSIQSFNAHGVPFGFAAGIPYGPPQAVEMVPGDMVVLMTDGFFEWENSAEEEFGMPRLEEAIGAAADLLPDQVIARMYDAVTAFAGPTPQNDDLTAVVIKRV
jgi:serine phosphatase RsbU (regulator of sigma subunit)